MSSIVYKPSLPEDILIATYRVISRPKFLNTLISTFLRKFITSTLESHFQKPESRFIRFKMIKKRTQSMPIERHNIVEDVERLIVYHDADRAGPHIEQYICLNDIAYNIGVKRLKPEHLDSIRFNNNDKLTEDSRKFIVSLLKEEYKNGRWLAQTTDHTFLEASHEWIGRDKGPKEYGAGHRRDVVRMDKVRVFKSGNTIEYRDYQIDPFNNVYVFGLMNPTEARPTRILKLGIKKVKVPEFQDRLHLKAHIGIGEYERFRKMIGEDGIVTYKHDGASFYFESGPNGTNYFSPRISKETGERINYNDKVGYAIYETYPEIVKGMGELVYVTGRYDKPLKAVEIGGLLNANSIVNNKVKLYIYRIDSVGKANTLSLPYEQNIELIKEFTKGKVHLYAPSQLTWDEAIKTIGTDAEGLVGVPKESSIIEGRKFKPRHDMYDWKVKNIALEHGPSGGIAGFVLFLGENGKMFKIGASGLGNRQTVEDIMSDPESYLDKVAKVSCYGGHEGRSPKFVMWHLDKGN